MLEDGGESASRPCPLAKLCFAFFYGLWYRICATKVIKDGKRYGIITGLADKYEIDIMAMTGFLDGINDSLITPNPIETMEEDTVVSLAFDKEKLYENMVDAKADWLYELPQWDEIFDADKKKTLYREAKNAHTIRNTVKVGRNDPCPCGSGRKYKQCCGKKNK